MFLLMVTCRVVVALRGVYYWMLNDRIKQLPPGVNQGLLAILWTIWGFASYYVALIIYMHILFDFQFWVLDSVRAFARTISQKTLGTYLLQGSNFFMFNIVDWLLSFVFVAILSAKTGSRKLWFMLFFASFSLWRLPVYVQNIIYYFDYYGVPGQPWRWAIHVWYMRMATMFIVQPMFIYLGFRAGEKLRRRIMGSTLKGEDISSISA